jgi:hypothetical protein
MNTQCGMVRRTSNHWIKTIVVSLCVVTQAHAQFILQPMQQFKTLAPGEFKAMTFKIENRGKDDTYCRFTVHEIAKDKEDSWVLLDPDAPNYAEQLSSAVQTTPSCRSWIAFPKDTSKLIFMPAQSTKLVSAMVTVPPDANGLYWAGANCALLQPPDAKVKIRYDFFVPIGLTIMNPDDLGTASTKPKAYHSVTPAVIKLEGRPGQTLNTSLSLCQSSDKDGDRPTSATLWAADVTNVKSLRDSQPFTANPCRSWITWTTPNQESSFSVASQKPTQIPIRIQIPKKARGHYSTVLRLSMSFGPEPGSCIRTKYSLSIPVQVNVSETPTQQIETQNDILIYNSSKYQILQDSSQGNPFFTYSGEEYISITSSVPTKIATSMKALSPAGGRWKCFVDPNLIQGDSRVKLSFLIEHLVIENITIVDHDPYELAELEIKLIPELKY